MLLWPALLTVLASATPSPLQNESCVRTWLEVRYRNFGYDHVVHLVSECQAQVVCRVSTNSNPDGLEVVVPAGEAVEVITFVGSPAREFTASVSCSE